MWLLISGNATRRISGLETLRGRANYYNVLHPAVNIDRARAGIFFPPRGGTLVPA
jgi:hypothetical protein